MRKLEYVTAQDIDGKISIRNDIGLIYKENNEYKTLRVDFLENFGTLEQYMNTAYESILIDEFSVRTREIMRADDYEGNFIYKIVLDDGKVISHYYTFVGFDSENEIHVVPTKIPLENKFTVDPTRVISTSWFYLESNDDIEYVQIKDIENNLN